MNFKGKTDVIAGDGRDLGHATALMLAREGAQVVCVDDNAVTKDARLLRRDTTCMHWENARILARHLRRWRIIVSNIQDINFICPLDISSCAGRF